ncbi:unnamed protein product [Clonostachys byssicola]|uniref:Uncharacterized protein n=1 Tax=Clonostachys byssicola TaxID=160290 RepID=A0A9N9U6B4_9HYPO|nr:unnamed protein product [Clonostachys byssicola]
MSISASEDPDRIARDLEMFAAWTTPKGSSSAAKVDGQGTKSAAIEFASANSATTFAWSAKSSFYFEYEDNETRHTADFPSG